MELVSKDRLRIKNWLFFNMWTLISMTQSFYWQVHILFLETKHISSVLNRLFIIIVVVDCWVTFGSRVHRIAINLIYMSIELQLV